MASTALPSWLQTSPDDIANKFVSGLQIGAQLGEARNKLAQQAQQSAVENQVTQDKLASDAARQAQELNVKKAYEDQQLGLKQQEVEAAQQKIALATAQAARTFQAQQSYQRDYQDAIDMGLPQDEAARGAMFKNIQMFGTGTGAATAIHGAVKPAAQKPEFMTSPMGEEIAWNPQTGGSYRTRPAGKSAANFDWTKFDATQIGKELTALRDTQAKLGPEDPGSADRASRMAMLNQKLEGMRGGNAPAAAPVPESASPSSHTEAPTASTVRVTVKSPDGKIGTIPADQLADALKAGFQQVK